MSRNKHKPYILVLPEDDANRQIANGFIHHLNINENAIQIMPTAGGWTKVINQFTDNYVSNMRSFKERRMVLLIDFDKDENRLSRVTSRIPDDLKERVFVLGVLSDPEELKRTIKKTSEEIGGSLAEDCPGNKNKLWEHDLLRHNESELERIILSVRSFLFI
jgi:hypothetical protein